MFKNIKKLSKELFPIILHQVSLEQNNNQIVSNANLKIQSPGITVIMGPNGSGKSVLVRLLHGLLEPTQGFITYGAHSLNKSIRRRQSMVFQNPTLLRRTVLANMEFVASMRANIDQARCKKTLDLLGLRELESQPAKLLSAGEKQRLALARSLILEPCILFLDEPTANLDPSSVYVIEKILKDVCKLGVKIIFITHDIGQAKRIADDIVFVNKGQILEHTDTDSFFQKPQTPETAAYLDGKIIL